MQPTNRCAKHIAALAAQARRAKTIQTYGPCYDEEEPIDLEPFNPCRPFIRSRSGAVAFCIICVLILVIVAVYPMR
jgi:hypothetical protein